MRKGTKFPFEEVYQAALVAKTKAATARALKVDYVTIESYCRRWPSLEKLFIDLRWELVSLAESGLWKKVESGDLNAVTFTLKTLGKTLGYTERQEIVEVDEPLEVVTKVVRVQGEG